MKQLLEVDRKIWASVKYFATLKCISVNTAVEQILKIGLENLKVVTIKGETKDVGN